ncbi:unnamed protein product [Macrosiphum euphorbiae]|uniref:RNA-directed DNA polymerase n=2 Tax=Macrosiphum euphorbiae TaxID=13131 RepID=A0AAV0Y8X6_9HEMI|nr:unnamed protein product [Macrosiphum euphorbiae]
MMDNLKPPKELNIHEAHVEWPKWKKNFNIYKVAAGISKKKKDEQLAIFLHIIGEDAREVFDTFETEGEVTELDKAIELFDLFYKQKINECVEAYKFNIREQKVGETFGEYLSALRKLSENCNFGTMKDRLIRDRVVAGIVDKKLQEKFLSETDLTLERVIDLTKKYQAAQDQKQLMNSTVVEEKLIMKLSKQQNKQFKQGQSNVKKVTVKQIENCSRCGKTHDVNKCPAYQQECMKCHKPNHFAIKCKSTVGTNNSNKNDWKKSKKTSTIKEISVKNNIVSAADSSGDLCLGAVFCNVSKCEKRKSSNAAVQWYEELQVQGKMIQFKLDTGAEANVIPLSVLNAVGLTPITVNRCKEKLVNYSGTDINALGKINLLCKIKSNDEQYLEFFVVNNENCVPILGLNSCVELKLINRVDICQLNPDKFNLECEIYKKFKDIFHGVGNFKQNYNLELKSDAKPVTHAPRKFAISLLDQLKNELNKLEKMGIIKKVNVPTEWVNSMVVIKKPNNELRICLDPQDLNKNLKRKHFPMATVEEIMGKMSEACIFSRLDAKKGFYQISLSEESSKLTTFNTPFGRYCFRKLPFGLNVAPEIFYKHFSQLLEGLEGVQVYMDDILVFGKNEEEHKSRLMNVLHRLEKNNVKLNKDKCEWAVSKLIFIGHEFSNTGVRPDPDKVKAIKEMAQPKCKKDIERFLGMYNYISKFIPHASDKTKPLRDFLKQNSSFQWSINEENMWNRVKEDLCKVPVLQYYNPNKEIILSVDASQYGVGAVLLQDNLPVAYASKALTEVQSRWAQIEKETYTIVWGCERFHQFIYGRKIIIESDHKPLEYIFKKPLIDTPLRLQRMRIRLQMYEFSIKFKKGSLMYIADTLSRAFIEDVDEKNDVLKVAEIEMQSTLEHFPMSTAKLDEYVKETEKDKDLGVIKKWVVSGWPCYSKIPDNLKAYWNVRNSLIISNGLLLKDNKIVVPLSLQKEVLNKIHYNHLGIQKCRLRAKGAVYWPNINKDIELKVKSCELCAKYQDSKSKEYMRPSETPDDSWQIVGIDIFHINNMNFLLVIDYFSKYVEIALLKKIDSNHVISELVPIFARFGIPSVLKSDGGRQLTSEQFKQFAKDFDMELVNSSPVYAQSNGMVERAIQTVKKMLNKALEDGLDWNKCLMEYRNTPISELIPAPAEILFKRKVKSLIPSMSNSKVKDTSQIKEELIKRSEKQKIVYDRTARKGEHFEVGDTVWIQIRNENKFWSKGLIIEKGTNDRNFKVKVINGGTLLRNRRFLKHRIIVNDVGKNIESENDSKKTNVSIKKSERIKKTPRYLKDYK